MIVILIYNIGKKLYLRNVKRYIQMSLQATKYMQSQ